MVSGEELEGLNVVLNEARLGPVHVDRDGRRAQIEFLGLMLDPSGREPDSRHLILCLTGISRIAGSLRGGNWDDASAPVLPLALDGLSAVITRMSSDLYGWEFFDPPNAAWERWSNRLSFDEQFSGIESPHVVELFQEWGSREHLDFRVWFEDAWIQRGNERPPLSEIIDNADRWWKGMYAGDPATAGHGIVPAGPVASSPSKPLRARFKRPWTWGR